MFNDDDKFFSDFNKTHKSIVRVVIGGVIFYVLIIVALIVIGVLVLKHYGIL